MSKIADRPTVRRLFDRIDTDGSNDLDRNEIVGYLRKIGLGSGLLGSTKVKQGADRFMQLFDTDPQDDRVTWDEFVKNGKHLLPPGLTDAKGQLDRTLVARTFEAIAGPKDKAGAEDVARYVRDRISGPAAMFAGSISDAVAKLAIDALDADGDKAFSKGDLAALLDDVDAQLKSA